MMKSNLSQLYEDITKLYADKENLFKSLGREVYMAWIMGVDKKEIKEFDARIKELDEKIISLEQEIKHLEERR
jgi:hypothetical protein